jgi:hypothetical protein
MQIVGLGVSVISFVALFQICFDLHGKVADLKCAGGAFEQVEVRRAMEIRRDWFIEIKYEIHKRDKDMYPTSSLLEEIYSIVVKNRPRGARVRKGVDGLSRSPLREIMWINMVSGKLKTAYVYKVLVGVGLVRGAMPCAVIC